MTTKSNNNKEKIDYDRYREEWLSEIESDSTSSSLNRGRRFGTKLITQWLDITTDDEDFFICDGSGDGGIDIAYLNRADKDFDIQSGNSLERDTWYLVQSKYGKSDFGSELIMNEGIKAISTLQGLTRNLANDSRQLLQRIDNFRQQASSSDRIVFVFATVSPISPEARNALDYIKIVGREKIFQNFDVEEVSLKTIWESLNETVLSHFKIPITGQFVEQSSGLLVGTVSLMNLFNFLKEYKSEMGNLDHLYEKNVRQFLGNRRKINKGIAKTLVEEPEKFGLYNNGITIVVSDYSNSSDTQSIEITDPSIVNGCQTTRTIWEILDSKLHAGGTGKNAANSDWQERCNHGGVVTKIVRSDEVELLNITRYTNSQNSVREQDFIALHEGFRSWKSNVEHDFNLFLEIQRGGIESRKAWEKQHPNAPKFEDYVNAFDLMKVYGAGWLAVPGLAFNKNAPFLPGGSIYSQIVSRDDSEPPFGAKDLYVAYKVKVLADELRFGRSADKPSRRQSRYLFYYIFISMLKRVILSTRQMDNNPPISGSDITESLLKLTSKESKEQCANLCNAAISVVDDYLTRGTENAVHEEESFNKIYNSDMNAFLKAENLGQKEHSPLLFNLLSIRNAAFDFVGRRESVAKVLIGD